GTLHDRRLAAARLHQEDAVKILFNEIAPTHKNRSGGYTRILKLNQRQGDAAYLAILEWVDVSVTEPTSAKTAPPTAETKKKSEKKSRVEKTAAEKTETEVAAA
ncbi:MAG: bL17 family ribosomal protein, partial [Limisphaerales bacterium]